MLVSTILAAAGLFACGIDQRACAQNYHELYQTRRIQSIEDLRRYFETEQTYSNRRGYRNYRRSYKAPTYSRPGVEGRETKKLTTWEGPTREDRSIDEEITKAQVDYGPTSPEVAKLMLKYAQRYFDAHDYTKAQAMAERIIKINNISKMEGINMNDVQAIRMTSMQRMIPENKPRNPYYRKGVLITDDDYVRMALPGRQKESQPAQARVVSKGSGVTEVKYGAEAREAPKVKQMVTTSPAQLNQPNKQAQTSGSANSPVNSPVTISKPPAVRYRKVTGSQTSPGSIYAPNRFRDPVDDSFDNLGRKFETYK